MASNQYILEVKQPYLSVYPVGTKIIITSTKNTIIAGEKGVSGYTYSISYPRIIITTPNEIINLSGIDSSEQIILDKSGTYNINYNGEVNKYDVINGFWLGNSQYSVSFSIAVVENHLPLKKWSITDVINRTLDLAEPIRKGEKPRFKLQGMNWDGTKVAGSQAEKFDKILAPEFAFTKLTLRECLQEVGKVIHGEPRLTPKKDENGKWFYEVSYDMFASQDESGIWVKSYILKTVSQVVDSYTSWLDSNAENLVNQIDKYGGVIVEPYRDGAKTVRTENVYARITEDNMLIATQYPIYSVDKLEYVYMDKNASGADVLKAVDITPWLFEKSIYDTQLSTYAEQYPYSKAYGLYYAQGAKNIGGLNFKVDAASFAVFKNYAIVNILRQATGDNGFSISDYPAMCFRVTYTPFYNVRVGQTKVNYKDFKRPAALIYNQAANVIESRYYGENLKGAVARTGNIDKSITYRMYRLGKIPQAGQMFDKDYYISAVTVEMYPTCFLVTLGLSKDFNRLSAYIGIDAEKRYSEVSQTQAVERNTLWREYIVVGDKFSSEGDGTCYSGSKLLEMIADTFTQGGNYLPLTNVCAWGTSYKGADLPGVVNLPVISSAFGNSISFSWRYEDNYSAGAVSQFVGEAFEKDGKKISGYFQNNYSYTDYYGRIYYYNFDLQEAGPAPETNNLAKLGEDLPQGTKPTTSSGYVSTYLRFPIVLRKDNREILQCNFQIDFVTNKDIIIGSALASYCPAIRGSDSSIKAKLYVFPTELNKFTDHVEAWEDVTLNDMPSAEVTVDLTRLSRLYFAVNAGNFPASGKSWAIVTTQTELPLEEVEDEFGNVSSESATYGGDLLIGQNMEVTAGQAFAPIYFTLKREIFDKTVWKDRL